MKERTKAKRFLICRFGGIGDSLCCTRLAAELKSRHKGCKVDFAVRAEIAELFSEERVFDRVLPTKRFPPSQQDSVEWDFGWIAIECIKNQYTQVFDLRFSIENNVPGPWIQLVHTEGPWRGSMSSNYVHWMDMSLGWCNIDPTTVEDKLPILTLREDEIAWAKDRLRNKEDELIIGVHLRASSLCRTWYRSDELPDRIRTLLPDATVLFFDSLQTRWHLQREIGSKAIDVKGENGLRKSAALVSQMQLFICADSGFSHVAAALGIPTLTLYTTVPGWTRERDYPKAHMIQSSLKCSPCFSLDGWCPRQAVRAREKLSDRENRLLDYEAQKVPPPIAAREMGMPIPMFLEEHAAVKQRLRAMSTEEPDCMKAISPEMIAEKAKEILHGQA